MACLTLSARPSLARGEPVLVEIGDSAETLLDARATRRLVALELADIDVPPATGNPRAPRPLFFRIVQVERDLRVELWERGEFLGARVVSGTNAGGQLAARRVALAAAELARRLQRKRQVQAERERSLALARAAAAAIEARRALDGPFALRSSLELSSTGSMSGLLAGPRLSGQWELTALPRRTRLEAGVAWLAGSAPGSAKLEWSELSVSLVHRFALAETLDLDLGLNAAAASVRLTGVRAVDAIADQHETWSARGGLVLRLEPRLSRHVRFSIGGEAGTLLRTIPFQGLAGDSERLRGMWLGLSLGVVLTPR